LIFAVIKKFVNNKKS